MRKLLIAILIAAALPGAAQVLTTEVWVGPLDLREGRFTVGEMKNISNHPGYDNQPSFAADGKSLLFSSEADSVAETGLGIQAIRYDLGTNKAVKLTKVRGFSPTPHGKSILTLREGTVWQYDSDGKTSRALLPEVKTAGYFTRFSDEQWILFMNEEQRPIASWDGRTLTRIVPGAITAPYRIPGQQAVSFVVQEKDTKTLMRLDVGSDRGTVLATIPFKTGGHHVWTSRGTLLMASGNAIHEWNPAKPEEWPVVHRFSEGDLQGITRIALSPAEDRIAVVSVPNDEVVLREARDARNKTFGKSYVRTIDRLEIDGDRATERGTWVRRWGSTTLPGEYTITWRRSISGSGAPVWAIVTERYASTP
jgi:WD40-like Beta Propeller Repeat